MKLRRLLGIGIFGFGLSFVADGVAEPTLDPNFSTKNYVEWSETESGRGTRADSDIPYAAFKASYATGTLTEADIDAVVSAMVEVLGARSDTTVKSFDPEPAPIATASGFGTVNTSLKINGFYNSPKSPSKEFTVTWGSTTTGADGSVTYPVTGEAIKFGSPPDNYTISYADITVSDLEEAGAAQAKFNELMVQLWLAMGVINSSGGRVTLGDDTTGGVFGSFRLGKDGFKWSFSGSSITYEDYKPESP